MIVQRRAVADSPPWKALALTPDAQQPGQAAIDAGRSDTPRACRPI
ncbi:MULTISPECIES: hypothetical protein [Roseateles]|uniref:Uncharacterized protein n=1 Tax=Pelomonas caseinilytica TaxID=2906763 RepID=A0ABS8XR89_9BURK|nr:MULTISPECIES: hypothetical protein [unclassified Roseateles]MCE4539730.1 hypothetical protein [Pelomonas sp. P7]